MTFVVPLLRRGGVGEGEGEGEREALLTLFASHSSF